MEEQTKIGKAGPAGPITPQKPSLPKAPVPDPDQLSAPPPPPPESSSDAATLQELPAGKAEAEVAFDPHSEVEAEYSQAVTLQKQGQVDEALAQYERLTKLDKQGDCSQKIAKKLKEISGSVTHKAAKEQDPQAQLALFIQAVKAYELLKQVAPDDPLVKEGKYEQSLAAKLKALGEQFRLQALDSRDQGTILALRDRGIAAYESVKRLSPNDPDIDYRLGLLHQDRAMNSYTMELRSGRPAMNYANDDVRAHFASAEKCYQAVIAADPNLVGKDVVADANYHLGRLHMVLGDLKRANQELVEALKLAPDDSDAQLALARIQLQQGQTKQGLKSYQKAIELVSQKLAKSPDDVALRQQLVDLTAQMLGVIKDKADSGLAGYQEAKRLIRPVADIYEVLRNKTYEALRHEDVAAKSDKGPIPVELRAQVNQLWAWAQARPEVRAGLQANQPPQTLKEAEALMLALVMAPGASETMLNSTQGVSKAAPPGDIKAALRRTISLVEAVRPDVAAFLRDELAAKDLPLGGEGDGVIAAWKTMGQDMALYDDFFKLNDDEKASILIHEATHAMSDWNLRRHLSKLGQTIERTVREKVFDNHDPTTKKNKMEYPAFLAQYAAFKSLGINENDGIYEQIKEGYETETGFRWPPAANNVELFKKIDKEAFISSADDVFVTNRSLAKASTMEERAQMIKFLLDQTPTSGAQQELAYNIIADASKDPKFKILLANLDRKQLQDELTEAQMRQVEKWYRR